MAGDWLKVEEATPDKPEIAILARKLGVSQGDAFLEWFRVYRWAGRSTNSGLVPLLSLSDADMLSGARPGTCAALASAEISWLSYSAVGLTFHKWDRHNSKSAKERALEQEKKRRQRANKAAEIEDLSPACPAITGTIAGTRREEETRGENQSSIYDRKTIGNSPSNGRSPESSPSSKEVPKRGKAADAVDLTGLDWDRVTSMAEAAARKVPPRTMQDRRAWLRFGVLAETTFSEEWLVQSAMDAVSQQAKRSRQALFVGVLKTKASEGYGIDEATFVAMLRRIEIPTDVWKSNVLEIRK